MTFWLSVYLVIFWVMQVVAQVLFKWGSTSESRWLWGFFGGNLFGFSSIWLLMLVYKNINPNIALGFAFGGAFLASQIALVLVFKSKMGLMQCVGVVAIVIGMIVLLIGKPPENATQNTQQITSPDHHSTAPHDDK